VERKVRVADLEFILSSKLPMMERMTMVVIASYINEGQTSAWPSIETIAERGGMSTASAARSVAMLRKNGFIGVIRRFSKSTIYSINHVADWDPVVSNRSYPIDSIQQPVMATGSYPAASYGQQPVMATGHDDHICQRKLIISASASILPEDYSTNEPTNILSDSGESSGDGFDAIWEAYDLKNGKSQARKAWARLSKRDREAAMAAIPAYVAITDTYDENTGKPKRKYLQGWLNAKRWEDEISSANGAEPPHGSDAWFNYHANIEAKKIRASQP
jgi:Helix-turn-helix domain